MISRSFLSVLQVDFNPRSPHGERQKNLSKGHCVMRHFNPRSPHGERLFGAAHRLPHGGISIHAPRTGSDRCPCKRTTSRGNFNPRSPHGERRCSSKLCTAEKNFNPRSPHGERPRGGTKNKAPRQFQSTLPARGATARRDWCSKWESNFNPRSPHGERRRNARRRAAGTHFNPRSPHGERPA